MAQGVRLDKHDGVSVISMDDGKANAFSKPMLDAIHGALDEVGTDEGALILHGRPGIFSGGFDLKVMLGGDKTAFLEMVGSGRELALRLLTFPRPVVISMTGHAIAMGAILGLTADWRVCASGDYKIGLNEVRAGIALPPFVVELARLRLNPLIFVEATLHSRIFSPDEAMATGFIDEVVAPGITLETAIHRARDLASLPNPHYRETKLALYGDLAARLSAAL